MNMLLHLMFAAIAAVAIASPASAGLGTSFAIAQIDPTDNPNEDRFLQPDAPIAPTPQTEPTPSLDRDTPRPAPESDDSPAIAIESIQVTGSTLLDDAELEAIVQPLVGQDASRADIVAAADRISRRYQEQGFLTSRALIVEESLATGNIQIVVVEGSLEEIVLEGTQRVNPSYIRDRLERAATQPLNLARLEDQLRLLRENPLFENVEASLRAGSGIGQNILVVRVVEADRFFGNVSINNYSPPSIGGEKIDTEVGYRNLTGTGDRLFTSFQVTSQGGATFFDLGYAIPLNARNGTLGLRAAFSDTEVIQEDFEELDIEGESELYEISYRQPFVRTPREEFALSLGFTYQDGQTFTFAGPTPFGFGPNAEGVTRTSVIKFGQDYVRRNPTGAWGLRSLFSIGTRLFDATENDSSAPDGQFLSWLAQVQRIQILGDDNLLVIQLDFQLASDPLLSSQQFVIGGGQSVRGYRQNVLAGDYGVRLTVEDRITIARNAAGNAVFQVVPFLDAGAAINHDDNPNTIAQENNVIASLGVGVLWEPFEDANVRLDFGVPLVDIEDETDNIQNDGLYFSLDYRF